MDWCWSFLVSTIILVLTVFSARLIITRRKGEAIQNSAQSTTYDTTPVAAEQRQLANAKTDLGKIKEQDEEEEDEEEEDVFIRTRHTRWFVTAESPANQSSSEEKSMYDEETKEKAKVVIQNAIMSKQLREL
uniref:Uncharacterized protein n=1 Tax=Trichuris muris TaxID=70415 RepID=A0A5S6QKE2_TRIMR